MSLLTIATRYYDERLACRNNLERLMGEPAGLGFDDPVKSEQKGEGRKEKPSTYF
jgi:hypothetical protein